MEINWESIEGYSEDMSAEDKLALLSKYQPESAAPAAPPKEDAKTDPKPDVVKPEPGVPKGTDKVIPKSQFDKVASELAAAKKQLRAKMSEDEVRELERQQQEESIKQELEALRKDKTLSTHKASLLSLGYDEQLASDTAEALTEGDMDAVFANMKKHSVGLEKTLRAQILKETPVPPGGENKDPENVDPFIEAFKKG